ncbi:hypothetical protein [Deinococcus sp.]|uniref:hypothetical protein n=1 Tax=Deinococcus sp. TaxID=47478 RepID=UPI0025E0E375|nr:hypothetical protein [Deinococcus sp.]
MAHPALTLIPAEAIRTFADGDDYAALNLLRRARDSQPLHSPGWAYLERVVGLVLIHLQREVEGTFALERADPLLDGVGWPRLSLEEVMGSGE